MKIEPGNPGGDSAKPEQLTQQQQAIVDLAGKGLFERQNRWSTGGAGIQEASKEVSPEHPQASEPPQGVSASQVQGTNQASSNAHNQMPPEGGHQAQATPQADPLAAQPILMDIRQLPDHIRLQISDWIKPQDIASATPSGNPPSQADVRGDLSQLKNPGEPVQNSQQQQDASQPAPVQVRKDGNSVTGKYSDRKNEVSRRFKAKSPGEITWDDIKEYVETCFYPEGMFKVHGGGSSFSVTLSPDIQGKGKKVYNEYNEELLPYSQKGVFRRKMWMGFAGALTGVGTIVSCGAIMMGSAPLSAIAAVSFLPAYYAKTKAEEYLDYGILNPLTDAKGSHSRKVDMVADVLRAYSSLYALPAHTKFKSLSPFDVFDRNARRYNHIIPLAGEPLKKALESVEDCQEDLKNFPKQAVWDGQMGTAASYVQSLQGSWQLSGTLLVYGVMMPLLVVNGMNLIWPGQVYPLMQMFGEWAGPAIQSLIADVGPAVQEGLGQLLQWLK